MATQPLTARDYLALDRAADFKSEFVDGIMYAMAGGSIRHSLLAAQFDRRSDNATPRSLQRSYLRCPRLDAGERRLFFPGRVRRLW